MNKLYGQYVNGTSLLHKLNAICKLLLFFLLIFCCILAHTPLGFLLMFGILGLLIFVSKLAPKQVFKSLFHLWSFFLLIFLMNAFFFSQEEPLWKWGIFTLTTLGMQQGFTILLRIIYIMILGNILLATTTPLEITAALSKLFHPLSVLKLPVDEIALIISVALQFIPILSEEAHTIKQAQIARGARFHSPHFFERLSSYPALILPLFLAAFRRADELSVAMEARGYHTIK